MRKTKLVFIAIIISIMAMILLLLTGCTYQVDLDEYMYDNELIGTITDKFHIQSREYYTQETVAGKTRTVDKYEPEEWYLRIERECGDDRIYTDIKVSEEIFNIYTVGDKYIEEGE